MTVGVGLPPRPLHRLMAAEQRLLFGGRERELARRNASDLGRLAGARRRALVAHIPPAAFPLPFLGLLCDLREVRGYLALLFHYII